MKKIVLLILLFTGFNLHGQNILTTTIRWNGVSTFNINTGETLTENTSVVSYPDHIEWKGADGSVKYTFSILEMNGSWTNTSRIGQVTFEVDKQGQRGTVQFKKDATGIKIRLMLLTDEAPEMYELTIANTEIQ